MRSAVVAGLLAVVLSNVPASGMNRRVPTVQYPTIQAAVDSSNASGDVILIDSGNYSEDVVITSKSIDFVGAGRDSTSVTSFSWTYPNLEPPTGGSLKSLHVVSNIDARLSTSFTIYQCLVDGTTTISIGLAIYVYINVDSSEFQGVVTLIGSSDYECLPSHNGDIRNCEFHANLDMASRFCNGWIRSCEFYGNAGVSLVAHQMAAVDHNTFHGAGEISVWNQDGPIEVLENILSGGSITANGQRAMVTVSRNTGARSISAASGGDTWVIVEDNVVRSGDGISVMFKSATIRRNIVMVCSRGILASGEFQYQYGSIENNTVYGCAGIGLQIRSSGILVQRIDNNIVNANGTGVTFNCPVDSTLVQCNDVSDNQGGNWIGANFQGVNGNFALDPLFCNPNGGNLSLAANSPCLPVNGVCGLVGALEKGCLSMGACCRLGEACTMTTEADCQAPGIWLGGDSICEPNPCLQCQVRVTAPNGGEIWPVRSQQNITWSRTDGCSNVVKIELLHRTPVHSSRKDIYRACRTIAAAAPNTGSYAWTVQRCGGVSSEYKVQITDLASGASDRSDGSFSISRTHQLAARLLEPEGLALPVPFRPGSPIQFGLRETGQVRMTIYDVLGRRIRTLVDGTVSAGDQEVLWDARTDEGDDAPSGIYYLEINFGDRQMGSKLLVIR